MTPQATIQTAFIAAFAALIALPTVQQYTHVVPLVPVVESRATVPLPPGNPPLELLRANGYFPEYEKHFNDVFGFRDFYIRLRNQIQFSLFNDSNQVVVGAPGWLSDKATLEVEQRTVDALNEDQMSVLGRRLVHLNEILKRRGIAFLVIPIPLKNTVYPDKYPAFTERRPAITGYQRFLRRLSADGVPFIDAFALLSQRRRTVDVYYHTDLHWNTAGAQPVAVETVHRLARTFHARVPWRYPDRYQMKPFVGGTENNVLATFRPIVDIEPFEDQYPPCGPKISHGVFMEYENRCSGEKLPPAMLYGNSFSQQMLGDGLADHFERIDLISDLTGFDKVLSSIRPGTRIVIWQLFELEIGYQAQTDAFWAEVDAAR